MASSIKDGPYGAFDYDSPEPGWRLAMIASAGEEDCGVAEAVGWEHVSVHAYKGKDGPSLKMRTPTWKEMAFVKRLFWDAEDVVVQFHPRESEYVNVHPHVLHLWRSRTEQSPTPPPLLVGPQLKSAQTAAAVDPHAGDRSA